jgi:hypothetical protein
MDAMKRENIERFEHDVEKGRVLEMHGAAHYIIQSNQQEVLEAAENFLSSLGSGNPRENSGRMLRRPRAAAILYA